MHHPPTPTQHRLLAQLVAAIYAMVDAIRPVIQTLERQPTRPWQQRASLSARFYAILRDLLALTTRIDPASLSPNPVFPAAHPRTTPPSRTGTPARKRPHPASVPPLSARRLAQRLANLVRQLMALAAEAGIALPDRLRRHAARAGAIAGCHALPASRITWESTG